MRFLIRKRRTAPAVIIVALIDVLIVLVIFLLVTTTFKQVPSLKLELPSSTQTLRPGANENPPLIVTIAPGAKGDLLLFGPDDYPMTLEGLAAKLKASVAANPNVKLAVRADKDAHWESVVKVMDAAKAANIKVMSAFTKQPGKP
jgi:biopolymer transport protein ExbD